MKNAIAWLAIALAVSACNSSNPYDADVAVQSPSPSSTSSPAQTPTAAADLPNVQCHGDLPEVLAPITQGYRLANESDFVPAIREFNQSNGDRDYTCSIFAADFDKDGSRDYALLLINEETSNFQVQFALNDGDGTFKPLILKEYERITEPSEGVVYTSLDYKPPGEPGLTQREYNTLDKARSDVYISVPAISTWRAIETDAEGKPKNTTDISSLAYCSDGFYFVNGNIEIFTVCD